MLSLITKTPPPKIASPAAIEPNVSVKGLDLAVIFSCLKFSSLAKAISLLILLVSKFSALNDFTFFIPLNISSKIEARFPT